MAEKKKKARRLKKILLISAIIIIAIVTTGWIIIANTVRPPEVPAIVIVNPEILISLEQDNPNTSQQSSQSSGNTPNEATPPPQMVQFEERRPMFFTFLIFGLTEGLNANTIMVAAYDAEAGQGYLISIPRDTLVDVNRRSRKIVSSYPAGRLHGGGHEGGVEQIRYEVSTLIGFRPDFYIRIDYEAFIRLVDAVGGVEIYVPFHMQYKDPYQDLYINLQAGLQVLDGEDALRFARYRMGIPGISPNISDYQRIEHQQQVLTAVFRRLLTPSSILRIPEFISIFNEHVYSDLTTGELLWFANQARTIGGIEALSLYTLPMAGTSGAPSWYEWADEQGILELVNRTINPLVRDITAKDLRIIR